MAKKKPNVEITVTRPDGQPATMMREAFEETYKALGYKEGYSEKKSKGKK